MSHVDLYVLSIYSAKSAIVLVFLVLLYRIVGKRELGQMNAYDLATIVAVSNAVQNAMTAGRGELSIGLVTSGTLVLVAYLIARVIVRHPVGERILLGQPVLLLSDGRMLTDRMRRERVSPDDLRTAIREHGLAGPSEVGMAVLEIDGSINVIAKSDAKSGDSLL